MFLEELPSPEEMNGDELLKLVKIQIERMAPGAFARQVMSLMCSVVGPWDLAERHTEIRSAVRDGATCAMPADLTLSMLLCPGPLGLAAGPSLAMDIAARTWRWVAVLAHPPLAFELELATSENREESPGCSIGGFLEHHEKVEGTAELELPIGFTNVAFPGDWRSRAQVERGLDIYGRPPPTPTAGTS
jgi:hypothetical protein